MAGLDDYQFFSTLREKDNPFWQKNPDDKERMMDPMDHFRRPTEFPENLLNPVQGTPNAPPPKAPVTTPRSDIEKAHDVQMEKYGELSINIVSLCAENLLSHPFIVVRRQCQVNINSYRYHLLPITLVPAIIHIQGCQGFSAFWKGLGSVLTVRGITLGLEDCISKFTPWPKEISPHSSLKTIGQHLLLKCSALALITPFYSASLVETVQSEIASEKPGVLDVFKEGLTRLLSFTQPQTGRMLPVWLLIVPTVTHGVLQYIIGNAVSTLTSQALRYYHRQDQHKQGAVSKESGSFLDASVRLQSAFIGHLASDVILYPLETILHRLHMQGTRTIIDSLDVGYEVKPILTRYEGFFDCLNTTVQDEGVLGLFKGFGSLCIQYALYGAVLKFAQVIIQEVTLALVPPKPKLKVQDPVTPLAPSAPYTPISAVHPGVASLHSSPLHPSRHQYGATPGNRKTPAYGTPGRRPDVDLRAELEKHKSSLNYDD
ncbi:mitochondrial outer membrane protein SLC25A46-like isoform X1 [Eriocheir sinensis]|uniref:mitochondrial outer membrane protein SLC25A46-like isoform X1 n=1 Tax=Eriocheir sinensis TaxID=95602 RepID=UPI0021C72BE7|nr:mitochondrial outer membrane protein SLC25A46-like isoform X1 [Eriocheir sinensis]XP_050708854.1 mitochondrial outer membrane protein SLC25A46-like isoform X1 [Eriocheir sinensis]